MFNLFNSVLSPRPSPTAEDTNPRPSPKAEDNNSEQSNQHQPHSTLVRRNLNQEPQFSIPEINTSQPNITPAPSIAPHVNTSDEKTNTIEELELLQLDAVVAEFRAAALANLIASQQQRNETGVEVDTPLDIRELCTVCTSQQPRERSFDISQNGNVQTLVQSQLIVSQDINTTMQALLKEQKKTTDTVETIKLKSIETNELLRILACHNSSSSLDSWKAVPRSLHSSFLYVVGGFTDAQTLSLDLQAVYGPDAHLLPGDKPFLKAIVSYLTTSELVDTKTVLSSIAMTGDTFSDLVNFVTKFISITALFQNLFDQKSSPAALKESALASLRPASFQSFVRKYRHDFIMNPAITVNECLTTITKSWEKYVFLKEFGSVHSLTGNTGTVNDKDKKSDSKKLKNCENPKCSDPTGHITNLCPLPCHIHSPAACPLNPRTGKPGSKAFCCYNARNALREAAKAKAAVAVVTVRSNLQLRHSEQTQCSSSSDRSLNQLTPGKLVSPLSLACLSANIKSQSPSGISDIIFDTGCNKLSIHDTSAVGPIDSISTPLFSQSITIADNSISTITESCSIGNVDGVLVPHFGKTLVPATAVLDKAIVILESDKLHFISNSNSTINIIDNLIESPAHILTTSASNGIYPLSVDELQRLCRLCEPIESNSAYYKIKWSTSEELVQIFHETLGHASKRDMILIVQHKIIDGLPPELTVDTIRKHFNEACPSCIRSTISEAPKPNHSTTVHEIGTCCALDISYWPVPDIHGHTHALHAVDIGSDMPFIFLLFGLSNLIDYLKLLVSTYARKGKLLRIFKMDKSFITHEIREYCDGRGITFDEIEQDPANSAPIPILIHQPGPGEHAQNGSAECLIKVQVQEVNKQLDSMNLQKNLWGPCLLALTDVRANKMSHKDLYHARTVLWGNPKCDLSITPMLPFGTRIIGRIQLSDQNNLTGRGFNALYFGRAPGVKHGILLRNLETNRTVVRVSWRIKSRVDRDPSPALQPVDIEFDDETSAYDYNEDYNRITYVEESGVPPSEPLLTVTKKSGVLQTPNLTAQLPRDTEGFPLHATTYRDIQRKDTSPSARNYFKKIGLQGYDNETKEHFKIVSICLPNITGKGSKTPYFKMYDMLLFPGGNCTDTDFEYQPCREVMTADYWQWDAAANRAIISEQLNVLSYYAEYIDQHPTDPLPISFEDLCNNILDLPATLDGEPSPLDIFIAHRASFSERPPSSRNAAAAHPEPGYFASWLRELASLHANGCLDAPEMDLKDIPPELILQMLPIFQKKFVGMNFEKFKCRCILLGNAWRKRELGDTYAGMVPMDVLKILLSIGAIVDADFILIDIETAFLTAKVDEYRPPRTLTDHMGQTVPPPLSEKYFVRRPPGATDAEMPYISQPKSHIYGSRKANEAFGYKINRDLIAIGCVPTHFDPNVLVLTGLDIPTSKIPVGRAIICRAVDDMPTLISGSPELKQYIINALQDKGYKLSITDPMHTALGLEIERDRPNHLVTLRQRGFTDDFLDQYLPSWRTCDIASLPEIPAQPPHPLCQRDQLLAATPCLESDKKTYNELVGNFNWILHTWPELKNAVRDRSLHLTAPSSYDLSCAEQILGWIARIRRLNDDGLILGGTEGVKFITTVDTSYAADSSLKSKTGITVHMSHSTGSVITECKGHPFITNSSCAAEGVGGAFAVRLPLAFRYFVNELGFDQPDPSAIYMDNVPFLQTITGNRGSSERSKFILLRMGILKEAYDAGTIDLLHLASANMVADIASKNTPQKIFYRLRAVMLGHSPLVLDPPKSTSSATNLNTTLVN